MSARGGRRIMRLAMVVVFLGAAAPATAADELGSKAAKQIAALQELKRSLTATEGKRGAAGVLLGAGRR
jgi:hypothetical protein